MPPASLWSRLSDELDSLARLDRWVQPKAWVHVNAIAPGTRLHAHTLKLGFITRSGRTRQWIAADEQNLAGARRSGLLRFFAS